MKTKDYIIKTILSSLNDIHSDSINKSIIIYKLVRELYERNHDITSNYAFQWAYIAYYGLSHYKKDDIPHYFQVLQKHIEKKDVAMDISCIMKELQTEKRHYVFASKLMNFVDDSKYPIVDSRISKVFWFRPSDSYENRYLCITNVYKELKDTEVIKRYLSRYDFSGIGIMKQLDILVWNIIST